MGPSDGSARWPTTQGQALAGRHRELAELSAELELARTGRPRVVTVDGPPGMGKSALVRHFVSNANNVGVLTASGDEWETRLSYGVVAQLLAAIDAEGDLATLGSADGPVPDPLSVGAQLLALLGSLAAVRPLVVVLDDVQWADPASVQALCFAIRRLRVDAVLTIVIGRDDSGVPEPFRRASSERGTHLAVGGLPDLEMAELANITLGTDLSPRAVARLVAHSGGSPLHARALLVELGAARMEKLDAPLPAPRSYATMVVGRLAGCSDATRRLVEAVAVLSPTCRVRLAAQVGELADPVAALDEAVAAGLLSVDSGASDRVGFTDPLTRAAVYHDLGPGRRAALHARAALVVEPRLALDHRVAAALDDDPVLAAELAAAAQVEAARGALAMAAGHLLDAARLSPGRVDRERLFLDAIGLLLKAGDVSGAALAIQGMDEYPDTPRGQYLKGHLAFLMGRQGEAEALLRAVWQNCDPETDPELCSLVSADLAQLCGVQMRYEEAAGWARRAIDTSEDGEVTAAALGVLVPCLGMVGRSGDALAAVSPFTFDRSQNPAIDVEALLGRGTVRLWLDDLVEARRDLGAVVEACRARPAARPALVALGALADVEYRLGAWDDSLAHATAAVSLAEDSEQRWMAAFLHSATTWALAPRGNWEQAEAHAAAASAAAEALGDPMSVFCAAAGGAHVAFFQGDYRRVVDSLQPLFDHDVVSAPEEPGVHPWRHLHAESLIRLDRLSEASDAVAALEALAAGGQRRSAAAHAALVRALLDVKAGDAGAARDRFETALGAVTELNTPFERARIHDAYGRFLRRGGERRAASTQLAAAMEIFDALGARPLVQQCQAELAACGHVTKPRRGPHAPELTAQQLAVARLVAKGLANKEIAAELVVSVKTVDYHLGQLYGRLGVHTRTQLMARLAASNPAPSHGYN